MRMHSFMAKCCALLLLLSASVFAAQDFLPPEKAFRVEASWIENSNQIEVDFAPAQGYYIYQESLKFEVGTEAGKLYNISLNYH